ncbi:uncharacterized protein LOC122510288 isoform X2 [Leptopilina heterotoma]|uniref:uncharacterized protein LOC122510288 isoform X2 n=1 Tax=Leptopilina heterotoma TaxID=63436 RepID=UPI001CA7F60B|nr:uncharacterized protein LOC122510288 isoform X2 [Leptopilina heterotoma]
MCILEDFRKILEQTRAWRTRSAMTIIFTILCHQVRINKYKRMMKIWSEEFPVLTKILQELFHLHCFYVRIHQFVSIYLEKKYRRVKSRL